MKYIELSIQKIQEGKTERDIKVAPWRDHYCNLPKSLQIFLGHINICCYYYKCTPISFPEHICKNIL